MGLQFTDEDIQKTFAILQKHNYTKGTPSAELTQEVEEVTGKETTPDSLYFRIRSQVKFHGGLEKAFQAYQPQQKTAVDDTVQSQTPKSPAVESPLLKTLADYDSDIQRKTTRIENYKAKIEATKQEIKTQVNEREQNVFDYMAKQNEALSAGWNADKYIGFTGQELLNNPDYLTALSKLADTNLQSIDVVYVFNPKTGKDNFIMPLGDKDIKFKKADMKEGRRVDSPYNSQKVHPSVALYRSFVSAITELADDYKYVKSTSIKAKTNDDYLVLHMSDGGKPATENQLQSLEEAVNCIVGDESTQETYKPLAYKHVPINIIRDSANNYNTGTLE